MSDEKREVLAYDGPSRIYLQWYEYVDASVTWCEDEINKSDVKFVAAVQLEEANSRIKELETALSIAVETLAPFAAAYMMESPLDYIHREDLARAAAVMQRWGKGVNDDIR